MISWDDAQQICKDGSNDASSTSLTIFKRHMNLGYKFLLAELGRPVTEKTVTAATVADQQYYQLPPDFLFMKSVTLTSGGKVIPLIEEPSQETWDYYNASTNSGQPAKYFLRLGFGINGGELGLYPKPSAASDTITIVYEATDKDLSQDKYTTGTITATNGSAGITGSGTTFTAQMAGRYFHITDSTGDGNYYKIAGFNTTTSITLENVYEGASSVGAAYEIVELFGLPEEMQILPAYYALWFYFAIKKDATQEAKYKTFFEQGLKSGKDRWATKSRGNIIREGGRGYGAFPMATPPWFGRTYSGF